MLLREVAYARPSSVADAVRDLAGTDGAVVLAGGQTLLNVMKARVASPEALVDLNGIDELRRIERGDDGSVVIGSMATLAQVIMSPEAGDARPILAEVADQIADVQVRNRGTIGGNICSNDPTNHLPPLLVALGATMTIVGADGERTVPAEEFFLGVYLTAVRPGELLARITVPAANGAGDGFASVALGRDGTCLVNAAASVDGGEPRVAIGCVSATPLVVPVRDSEPQSVRDAVAGAGLDPPSDVHASADYRRHLAGVVAARAVQQAVERRGG
jgi:aerobic carbon-monoxide dehydrogenase medium subunit